ncbi:hypothetical protein [Piscinibacter sakaiensis]|uniref:hypothetical protein n=1 Tax=Piscinibacter sakaiensis TaxID=1547922 RepID=UPI003AABB47D
MLAVNEPVQQRPAVAAAWPGGRRPRVKIVGADGPLFGLLQTWFESSACTVSQRDDEDGAALDLIVIELAFPRQGGVDSIRHVANQHPGVPILVLSSTFLAGIDCCGQVAKALGVDGVLPNPVSRDALLQATRRILPQLA